VSSHDCRELTDCASAKTQIRQLVERFRTRKVTAVPRQNADAAITLTAWGWLDKLSSFDVARITASVNAWRDCGPERTEN